MKLIQTKECSIIYGTFQGETQELFRCPRALDNIDLKNYVNENRCLLGFEPDTETKDLKESERYLGYYRLYFRGGWYGRWMEGDTKVGMLECAGVDEIIRWLRENFPKGCGYEMQEFLTQYPTWGGEQRWLLKPLLSEHYKVMFDTTYGNEDYPVRVYVYQ